MNSLEKIKAEFKDITTYPLNNIGCCINLPDNDNYYEWKITYISGPDSLYACGFFYVKLLFPQDYPAQCPQITFVTPIYHLNVNPKKYEDEPLGHVMLDITNWWNPQTTIREVLVHLYSIFYCQNSDAAYGIDRAKEYTENRRLFELKVKYFTHKYADPLNSLEQFDDKDWDFNCSEKDLESIKLEENEKKNEEEREDIDLNFFYIELTFIYNEKTKTTIQCRTDELMKNVIKKCMNKLEISENLEKLLVIFIGRKIDLNSSLKANDLINDSNISIIHDRFF
jgi:ubiquitin-protein ligase